LINKASFTNKCGQTDRQMGNQADREAGRQVGWLTGRYHLKVNNCFSQFCERTSSQRSAYCSECHNLRL